MSRTFFLRIALIAVIFVGAPLYWGAFPPRLPISTANGLFASACCGTVVLRDGRLTLGNGREVAYVVERDNAGRYILPVDYVGTTDHGLLVKRNGNPLKLRLDDVPRPRRIEVVNATTGDVVMFDRANGS